VYIRTKEEMLAKLFHEVGTALPVDEVLAKTGIKNGQSLYTYMWRLRPTIQLHRKKGYVVRKA
jgi:hypothetical protein